MQLMVEQATLAKTKSIGTSTRGRMLFARCALSAFRYLPLLRTARRRRSRPELAHQDDEQRAEAYAATRGGAAQRLPGGEESVAGTNLEACPSPGADMAGASPVPQGHLNCGAYALPHMHRDCFLQEEIFEYLYQRNRFDDSYPFWPNAHHVSQPNTVTYKYQRPNGWCPPALTPAIAGSLVHATQPKHCESSTPTLCLQHAYSTTG